MYQVNIVLTLSYHPAYGITKRDCLYFEMLYKCSLYSGNPDTKVGMFCALFTPIFNKIVYLNWNQIELNRLRVWLNAAPHSNITE